MSEGEQLLQHILEHGDVIGRDRAGRTIIQLAVADTVLDELLSFGADAAESEDGGDDEPLCRPACFSRLALTGIHSADRGTPTCRGSVACLRGTPRWRR
jgi:hypothetical protein